MEVNDTMFLYAFDIQTCYIVAEAIDSITLNNGSVRKRIKVKFHSTGTGPGIEVFDDYLIVGIGSTSWSSFDYTGACFIDGATRFSCFLENEEVIYPENSSICALTNVEETLLQNNIQIYPNPVSDQLKIIEEDQQLVSFELLNLTGKLIKSGAITSREQTINLDNIQPGMYLLALRTKTGAKLAKKILKQ